VVLTLLPVSSLQESKEKKNIGYHDYHFDPDEHKKNTYSHVRKISFACAHFMTAVLWSHIVSTHGCSRQHDEQNIRTVDYL